MSEAYDAAKTFYQHCECGDDPLESNKDEPVCLCGVPQFAHHHALLEDVYTYSLTHNGCEKFIPNYKLECCACSWSGFTADCVTPKHQPDVFLCPVCYEVTEPV